MIGTNPHAHALHRADEPGQTGQLSTPSPRAAADQASDFAAASSEDCRLGVLLRQTQWLLDDAAHDIPAGRYHPSKRDELAVVLEYVAGLVRATTSKAHDDQ